MTTETKFETLEQLFEAMKRDDPATHGPLGGWSANLPVWGEEHVDNGGTLTNGEGIWSWDSILGLAIVGTCAEDLRIVSATFEGGIVAVDEDLEEEMEAVAMGARENIADALTFVESIDSDGPERDAREVFKMLKDKIGSPSKGHLGAQMAFCRELFRLIDAGYDGAPEE